MKSLITYFTTRHLLSNVLFFGTLILSLFIWKFIGKEEMPEFSSNWVSVNTIYPGASAEDVELFVTKPIEDELKSVVGLEDVSSTSSVGVSSFRIVIDDDYPNKDEVVKDLKDAVLRVKFPSEVRDLPTIRQFKSSEKAILDIGFYHKNYKILTDEARAELQKYILSFESQLLALSQVSSIDRSHYRKPELKILVNPNQKDKLEISLYEILNQIRNNHIRVPIGSLQDMGESRITAQNEYENVETLNKLILRGNYTGKAIRLGDIATIEEGFEKSTSVFKINGHEAIFLNIRKSVSTDILVAQKSIMDFVESFNNSNPNSPMGIVLMDDESYAVTNRLDIIGSNGLLGFILIVIILLVFLDFKSGFWVAMGIPFSMAFTLLIAHLTGYTVNNMTLAGIIIVLGIVVDDAIVIVEHIARKRQEGLDHHTASIEGAHEVFKPIIASILTTCVAFIPLIYFEGFFGKLVAYIPFIVILMLIGSLIESLFILPAHMASESSFLERFSKINFDSNWFHRYEEKYQKFILKAFDKKLLVFGFFIILLLGAGFFYFTQMKYEMFPREESEEVVIKVEAPKDTLRHETAKLIDPLESMIVADEENVVAVRSSIALSRRGGSVKENEASVLVELHPRDKRTVALKKIIEGWEEKSKDFPGDLKIKFLKGRWGHDSGSAIEVQIQENNDIYRNEISELLASKLRELEFLHEVEIEDPLIKKEYIFQLIQEKLIQFDMEPAKLTTAMRTLVEGSVVYSINKGDEEIDVRLSVPDSAKTNINALKELKIENRNGQLVNLNKMVEVTEVNRPVNIKRTNYKRSTMIFADLKEESRKTPLEVAEILEKTIFPSIINQYPTAILSFKGEIDDSRESQGEFFNSIIIVVLLIYLILVIMFNSLFKPLLVLSIVPFGLAGVIFILIFHGMSIYGFFAVVGALGMIGVVINDAIIMIDRIDQAKLNENESKYECIARLSTTRLRPIILTTVTTVIGVLPTAYGIAGYDSMLAEMMLVMGWGLLFGTMITLVLLPCLYALKSKNN